MIKEWKPVVGYEGLYEVSNMGRVKSLKRLRTKERIIAQFQNHRGYARVTLWKDNSQKKYSVHRLVAEAFIPNPNNLPEVNHIDGDKQNNHMDNLEWCTRSENILHAYRTGLEKSIKGAKHHRSKLTQEQADYIRSVYKKRDPIYGGVALAMRFGVSLDTIMNIMRGVCYGC